jgi:hypothetical protein
MKGTTTQPIRIVVAAMALASSTTAAQGRPGGVKDVPSFRGISTSPSWTMAESPDWTISGENSNPDDELDSRRGGRSGTILRDGSVLLADGTRLLKVSPQGGITARIGRMGSGPQEFRDIMGVCLTRGDSVIVTDGGNQRTSLLTPSGTVVKTRPFGVEGSVPSTGCYSNGDVAHVRTVGVSNSDKAYIQTKRVLPSGGVRRDSLTLEAAGPDRLISWPSLVVALGTRTILSDGRRIGLQIYNATGSLEARWNIREAPEEMSEADKERCALRSVPRSYTPAQTSDAVRRKIGEARRRNWPTHGSIKVDDRGRTWVQNAVRCDGVAPSWLVLDSTGVVAATFTPRLPRSVQVPDDVLVLDIARDRMLLWWTDTDGAPVVSLWRIESRR